MENRKDYEKRLGERLEAAYMQEDIGPVMSREEFHRLIQTAEKKKKHRRTMLSLAAACVALCLMCGGFMAGMTMRESASAGKDDETKIVQQGDSVIIGSGASENNQNVGTSTKTYTDIEDIPEDLREQIHFLDSDEFELEKVKVVRSGDVGVTILYYENGIQIKSERSKENKNQKFLYNETFENSICGELEVYIEEKDEGEVISFMKERTLYSIFIPKEIKNGVFWEDLITRIN